MMYTQKGTCTLDAVAYINVRLVHVAPRLRALFRDAVIESVNAVRGRERTRLVREYAGVGARTAFCLHLRAVARRWSKNESRGKS